MSGLLSAVGGAPLGGGIVSGALPNIHVKNVIALDPAHLLGKGLADRRGEKVLISYVSENSGSFRAALGI
jgi:hypothetical protein